LITSRTKKWHGVGQFIDGDLLKGHSYNGKIFLKLENENDKGVQIDMKLQIIRKGSNEKAYKTIGRTRLESSEKWFELRFKIVPSKILKLGEIPSDFIFKFFTQSENETFDYRADFAYLTQSTSLPAPETTAVSSTKTTRAPTTPSKALCDPASIETYGLGSWPKEACKTVNFRGQKKVTCKFQCSTAAKLSKHMAVCYTNKNVWEIRVKPVCPFCTQTPPEHYKIEFGRWKCSKKGKYAVECYNQCDKDLDLTTEDWVNLKKKDRTYVTCRESKKGVWDPLPSLKCEKEKPPCMLNDNPLIFDPATDSQYLIKNGFWDCQIKNNAKLCAFKCQGVKKAKIVQKCLLKPNKWKSPKGLTKEEIKMWPNVEMCP